jgi:tetratricopeptide (TPR) repeat protein
LGELARATQGENRMRVGALKAVAILLAAFLAGGGCRRQGSQDQASSSGTPPQSGAPTSPARSNSEEAVAANNRGEGERKQGKNDEAIREYDQAIRLDPTMAQAFNNRGLALAAKGEKDKALTDYAEAIRLNPALPAPFANRGMIWQGRSEWRRALEDYAEATRLDPKMVVVFKNRGVIRATCPAAEFRDGEEALKDARRACELTDWADPTAISTLSFAYAELGQFNEAVKWQKKALENAEYERVHGEAARRVLKLFEERKPYRQGDVPPSSGSGVER